MSIKFVKHRAAKNYNVGIFKIKKGDEILKICFSGEDEHESHRGVVHLDIWGKKLEELRELLRSKGKINSVIEIAKKDKRDYITPEDVDGALNTTPVDQVRLDVLEVLGNTTGFGAEDHKLCAFVAWHGRGKP